jgi:hypothetical protein
MTPLEIRLAAYAGATLLLLSAVLGGWAYVHGLQSALVKQEAATAAAQAQDKHDAGQAALAADTATIVQQGAAKADLTVHVQQENANVLASSPGAAAPLDPGLVSAVVAGLCRYSAYAGDPGCAGLRSADSAVLSAAR